MCAYLLSGTIVFWSVSLATPIMETRRRGDTGTGRYGSFHHITVSPRRPVTVSDLPCFHVRKTLFEVCRIDLIGLATLDRLLSHRECLVFLAGLIKRVRLG